MSKHSSPRNQPLNFSLLTDMVELKSLITGSKALKYIYCEIIFNVVIYIFIY